MYAVIKTGGKQYRVAADDKIQIEKLAGNPGDRVQFTDVLMVANGGSVEIGAPFLAGATVVGEIASQDRGPHVIIFKKRRRKHYRRRNGHRQDLTSVTIREILTGGAKPAVQAEAAPAAAEPEAAPAKKPRAKARKAEAAEQE
jgi:large subunit ribosomal protein L21